MIDLSQILFGLFAFCTTCLHFVFEPLRWNKYLQNHLNPVQSGVLNSVFYATALASYMAPFKLGLPFRIYFIKKYLEMPAINAVSWQAVDSALSIAIWTICGALSAIMLSMKFIPIGINASSLAVPAIIFAITAVSLVFAFRSHLVTFFVGLDDIRRRTDFLAPTLILLTDVLSYGIRHVFIAVMFGISGVSYIFIAAAGIFSIFTGMLSGLPMGLLGYDAMLSVLLIANGVSPIMVAKIILANRLMTIVAAVILGVPAFAKLGFGNNIMSIFKKIRSIASGRN